MCGIVAGIAQRDIVPVLLEGLKRLEYRGYDSCGIAVLNQGSLIRLRSVERVEELETQRQQNNLSAHLGVAHTRWATHGAAVTQNAHPIFSGDEIALVHNGIIENYEALRGQLKTAGYQFVSETDTEVIAHLIHSVYRGDLLSAVQQAVKQLRGAYAIAVLARQQPELLVGARSGSPLIVALGTNSGSTENFLASDALAIAGTSHQIIDLEEGDVVALQSNSVHIVDKNGDTVERQVRMVPAYETSLDLGPYQHYMQKEIFEQPRAIADTLEGIATIDASLFGADAEKVFTQIDRVLILACGTSYYAGLTAKYWLEDIACIPTQVEVASEYRYRQSVPHVDTLVIVISQSGETADTLAALKHAQSLGMRHTLAICNVGSSNMVRLTALKYLTRAGTEIGVASTKAFTTQLIALFLLTLALAKVKSVLSAPALHQHLQGLRHLPVALQAVLALEPSIIAWSSKFAGKEHALFLGRGLHWPIALEGALKLKEISYIHAEAYPAGELKHGPLALVTEEMPVVTVAPNDSLLEKLKSNMQEVRARGGQLYVFADADTHIQADTGLHVIRMPEHHSQLSPILHVLPLQLLAYHTACALGTDVDKPRNLAKSVTVE